MVYDIIVFVFIVLFYFFCVLESFRLECSMMVKCFYVVSVIVLVIRQSSVRILFVLIVMVLVMLRKNVFVLCIVVFVRVVSILFVYVYFFGVNQELVIFFSSRLRNMEFRVVMILVQNIFLELMITMELIELMELILMQFYF